MAITLPTFTVTDPVKEARILDAFKLTPTSTNAEAAGEYKRWLEGAIKGEVLARETRKKIAAANESAPAGDLLS